MLAEKRATGAGRATGFPLPAFTNIVGKVRRVGRGGPVAACGNAMWAENDRAKASGLLQPAHGGDRGLTESRDRREWAGMQGVAGDRVIG